ncbi:MAG: glycoside hydrolase family 10, partial [Planctomycetota bacterium]
MGHFHFEVPPAVNEAFLQARWQDAYICGIEGIPWQCRCRYEDAKLTITRSIDASGKLHLVCPVGQLGDRSLSTCSLREVDRPYLLYVELARGSCFRVQSQADAWQRAGLALEPRFEESLLTGTKQFLDAVSLLDDADRASSKAIEAIETLESACDLLGDSYTKQSLAFRKRQEPQIGTLLAGTLIPPAPSRSKHEKEYCTTFNAAAVRLNWADIENDAGRYDYDDAKRSIQWCADNQIRVIGGPLLDFRERMMPHWLYLLEDDFEALLAAIVQFTERTVTELRGTVQLWNAASGLNSKGPISVDDEKSMRIALGILQTIRRLDPGTPAIMSFDQPFGEYLSKDRNGISPLHFADAIARSGLGMAGIGLDIRFNYESQSTFERSAVDFGLMIDRWATLGLPLLATI